LIIVSIVDAVENGSAIAKDIIAALTNGRCISISHENQFEGVLCSGIGRSRRQNHGDDGFVTSIAIMIVLIANNRQAKRGCFDHPEQKVTIAGETIMNGNTTGAPKIRNSKNSGLNLLDWRQFRKCSFIYKHSERDNVEDNRVRN